MTEAERERAAIVEWLRAGGQFPPEKWQGTGFMPTLGLRIRVSWITFRRPWAFAQHAQISSAQAIERGEHIKEQTP